MISHFGNARALAHGFRNAELKCHGMRKLQVDLIFTLGFCTKLQTAPASISQRATSFSEIIVHIVLKEAAAPSCGHKVKRFVACSPGGEAGESPNMLTMDRLATM